MAEITCYSGIELWGMFVMVAVIGWFLGYLPGDKRKRDD